MCIGCVSVNTRAQSYRPARRETLTPHLYKNEDNFGCRSCSNFFCCRRDSRQFNNNSTDYSQHHCEYTCRQHYSCNRKHQLFRFNSNYTNHNDQRCCSQSPDSSRGTVGGCSLQSTVLDKLNCLTSI
ncbi:hypothetical protein Btru_050856 [Bulinus truncatus]|nr:hypothetical protein Btru_050856 [Bulinus truncatus]